MKISPNHILEMEIGDEWEFRNEPSLNTGRLFDANKLNELIVHATGRASIENAESYYKKKDKVTVHLLIGKDGKELVQLVPFNRQAKIAFEHNKTSIAVALDYYRGSKNQPDADPRSYLVAIASNNKQHRVALYPPDQLNALLDLAVFLQSSLNLNTFLSINEILTYSLLPGPAFPITKFKEMLFERTGEKMGAKIVLEEVIDLAILRNSPDPQGIPLTDEPLSAGTRISIAREWKDWVRVEVMEEIEGNPWLVGWLEKQQIQPGIFEPVVRDHLLYTKDKRQYKFIPARDGNYGKKPTRTKKDIDFVVMHITTGTQIQQTINHFRGASGVSAHLVIGRDGRVIQMVPFNHEAYHAGSGLWEGKGTNPHSIGIEVDNAGKLTQKLDGSYAWKKTIIPDDQVECIRHWKDRSERPWQKFTRIQLEVTEAVVLALKANYQNIHELLEHERISLLIRSDPGPLFPMKKLRKKVLKREMPKFRLFQLKNASNLYENACYKSPNLEATKYNGQLPEAIVEVLEGRCAYWTKIKVINCETKPNHEDKEGWVRKDDVKYFRDQRYKMTRKQDFYRPSNKPPALIIYENLPAGTPVRVQKTSSGWSLISTPDHKEDHIFLEGWVKTIDLEETSS